MPAPLKSAAKRARLPLEWAFAKRARPGDATCGDAEVVRVFPGGMLLGCIDGLGRGQEAALAAESAVKVLHRYARQPLPGLVKRCHRTLMLTRGAALSLASFRLQEDRSLRFSWLGVGNVEGWLLRAQPGARPEPLPLYGGIAGYYLPMLRETSREFAAGDTLIVHTDGLRSDFALALKRPQPATRLAEELLELSFRGTDDALVLVVHFQAPEPRETGSQTGRRSEPSAVRTRAARTGGRRRGQDGEQGRARPIQEQSHDDFAE